VAGKGFVWSYPDREGGRRVIRTDVAVLYVGDEAEKQALLLGEPDVFFTTRGYDGFAYVMLRLEKVGARRLRELLTDMARATDVTRPGQRRFARSICSAIALIRHARVPGGPTSVS
jgi:hypothetical protein